MAANRKLRRPLSSPPATSVSRSTFLHHRSPLSFLLSSNLVELSNDTTCHRVYFLLIYYSPEIFGIIYIYIERKPNIPKIESNFFRIDVFQDTKKRSYRAPSNSVLFYFTLCRVIRRKKRKEKGKKKIVTEIVTWSHDIRMGNRDYRVGSFEIKRYKSD